MTILVTGSNGQLGRTFRDLSVNSIDKFIFTDITEMSGEDTLYLDVTDPESVEKFVKENKIDIIVNCAGYTEVDKAESDTALCTRLNAKAPEYLAKAIGKAGGLLVHISSDYVFGGNSYNTPRKENQESTPTGVYGMTKLSGEQAIISSGCDYVIIRTAWLHSSYGKNFVKTMMNLTSTRPELNVVFDQTGTPTYAPDLAATILIILKDYTRLLAQHGSPYAHNGIYHYSNEGVCSWYDFTKMIAEYAGNTGCDIKPCHSDEFPSKVKRPAYSVLDKTKIKETFGISIPYWTDSLKKCIASLKEAQ